MILSCTTCSLRGYARDEILSCFQYAPAAGYQYWGIAGQLLWTLGGARWFDARKAHSLSRMAGLQGCTEVYGPSFPTDSVEKAEAAAEDIALLFDVAESLESPLVVISGGRRGDSGLDSTIAGIRKLLPLIEDKKAKLALEPHHGSQFQTREDYDRIFAAIDHPKVGITVDTGHFHTAGVDWKQLIQDYGSKIYNVHVKDHIGAQSVPLGRGEIDLPGMAVALRDIGYQGALAVELEVKDSENLPRYVEESYRYLSQLLANH